MPMYDLEGIVRKWLFADASMIKAPTPEESAGGALTGRRKNEIFQERHSEYFLKYAEGEQFVCSLKKRENSVAVLKPQRSAICWICKCFSVRRSRTASPRRHF